MITPPGRSGVAFTERGDGDLRGDLTARAHVVAALEIPGAWATVRQVHGSDIRRVASPGDAGDGDAIWTSNPRLPLAVFTADCFGVVLHGKDAIGVAHAGWRGINAGVVEHLRHEMDVAGHTPDRAEVGPGIGPCCFEVGPEVAVRFEPQITKTSWGTTSVDLSAAISDQLEGLDVWTMPGCTHHEEQWFSHRRDGSIMRLATIGWRVP